MKREELEKLEREATPRPWEEDPHCDTSAVDEKLSVAARNHLPALLIVVEALEELCACCELDAGWIRSPGPRARIMARVADGRAALRELEEVEP